MITQKNEAVKRARTNYFLCELILFAAAILFCPHPAAAYSVPTMTNSAYDNNTSGTEHFSGMLSELNGVIIFDQWEWDNCSGGVDIGDTITVNGVSKSPYNGTYDVNNCEIKHYIIESLADTTYDIAYSSSGGYTNASAKMAIISNLSASTTPYFWNRDGGYTASWLANNRNSKYSVFTDGSYWITNIISVDENNTTLTPFGKQTTLYGINGIPSSNLSFKLSTSSTEYIKVGATQSIAQYSNIETYIMPFVADFGGATSTPEDLTIVPALPLCEDQDQIFNLNFQDNYNGYRYYFAFNAPVCSIAASFDGFRDLSIYNLGQAFSTSTSAFGSSTLALCSYLVDNNGEPVSVATSYYDVYSSTSAQCAGFYGYDEGYWCDDVCAGLATSTLGGEVACGGRRIACWAFMPHSTSRSYFSQGWEKLKSSFPFSVYFDITDAFHGFSTSTHEVVGLYAPAPAIGPDGRATLTQVLIIDQNFTKNLVGGETAFNFYRSTILGVFWILACLYVVKKMKK